LLKLNVYFAPLMIGADARDSYGKSERLEGKSTGKINRAFWKKVNTKT
jgi:hypothetical protein